MGYELITVERKDAAGIITINRPKALNALNEGVLKELHAAFDELGADPSVKAVVLTGAGDKAFIAGADISHMADLETEEATVFADLGISLTRKMEALPKPVIAAVNGFALGGGTEVALSCDMVFASSNARFGQPEVRIGIIPGFGGTQRLARLVGKMVAKELIFTGKHITAERAHAIGLVNEVVEPGTVLDRALAEVKELTKASPLAIAKSKLAMEEGYDLTLASGLQMEKLCFTGLFGSHDQREGMKAFVEKRKPEFTGK